jgi:hypothetical protein
MLKTHLPRTLSARNGATSLNRSLKSYKTPMLGFTACIQGGNMPKSPLLSLPHGGARIETRKQNMNTTRPIYRSLTGGRGLKPIFVTS